MVNYRQDRNMFSDWQNRVNNDIFTIEGSGAPTNGTSGTGVNFAGPGSVYIDTATGYYYYNTNTKASPTWVLNVAGAALTGDVTVDGSGVATIANNAVTSAKIAANTIVSADIETGLLQRVTGTISSANITGTSAGQLGHAQGVVLQAAPGASVALQLVAFGLYYTFATAAYTGGGNITVNWGAGGAVISSVVTFANSLGAASSKALFFVPLAVNAIAIVSNASLNLVAASAPTQPGTAAGTVAWELWYRTMAVGF